jgi:hypothetical protein
LPMCHRTPHSLLQTKHKTLKEHKTSFFHKEKKIY